MATQEEPGFRFSLSKADANLRNNEPAKLDPTPTSAENPTVHAIIELEDLATSRDIFAASAASNRNASISTCRAIVVIATLVGMTFLNSMGTGILIAATPRMATDLDLPDGLILWPAASYAVAAGCLLLPLGAVADIVGAKETWVLGSFLYLGFTVAIGRARTGLQLIVFRVLQGVSIAMCLPTTVSLISNTFAGGVWRTAAFAINGMGQPLGFALGLVLGGVFTDTIGWRWAFYMMALINVILSVASIWSLPLVHHLSEKTWARRLREDIDWIGAALISIGLGLLLYVLAVTTSSYRRLRDGQNIALMVLSVVLLAMFPLWMRQQENHSRPALIPNKIWRNPAFTSICIAVFLAWASLTCMEYYFTLYFQEIEGISAIQSSIRFLPNVIWGVVVNIATGYLISRVNIHKLTVISAIATAIGPILMATTEVGESYWLSPFWAMLLSPTNPDVLFTVSNLVISDAFPPEVQSLAGGVFNEASQFGNSVGLAITSAIAASVTNSSRLNDPKVALMAGYRAAFWLVFAASVIVVVFVFFGLQRGLHIKRE